MRKSIVSPSSGPSNSSPGAAAALLLFVAVSGCASPGNSSGGSADLAVSTQNDLATVPRDLAGQPPQDLAGQPPRDLAGQPPQDLVVVPGKDMASAPPDMTRPPDDLVVVGKGPGESCAVDGDCASNKCIDLYGGNKFCVTPCKAMNDCNGLMNMFCEPITAGNPNGYCVPRHPAHCASCARDLDCGSLSERCTQAPGDIAPACHIDCAIDGPNACPADYSCTAVVDAGVNRKLCLPNGKVCLDAIGGWCDRVALPQACARTNPAGTCTGQRACLANTKRFDKCGAIAPQFKQACNMPDPAGCMLAVDPNILVTKLNCGACGKACANGEDCCGGACTPLTTAKNCGACAKACANNQDCCGGACTAVDTVQNCGACGVVCPGQGNTSDAVCTAGKCDMTCRGDNYDVDKATNNGCEVADIVPPGHTQQTATNRGNKPCDDGPSSDTFSANVPSDTRVHANPNQPLIVGNIGAAPDWWQVQADGGVFCVNDYAVTFTTSGGGNTLCYQCTITTNKKSDFVQANGHQAVSMSSGASSYSGGGTIFFKVEKICNTMTQENVSYSVAYHL